MFILLAGERVVDDRLRGNLFKVFNPGTNCRARD